MTFMTALRAAQPLQTSTSPIWQFAALTAALLTTMTGACADLDLATCPDGTRCPDGTVCAASQNICIADNCGDGFMQNNETCDDGNLIDGDGCSATCRSEVCGNGVIDEILDEVCDDGNTTPGDGCSADCLSDETCGNGITDQSQGETCDDGNRNHGDGCSDTCHSEMCGNGRLDFDEECDTGGESATCNADCTEARCGDNQVNASAGEECDDGGVNTSACDSDCTLAQCGDGRFNPAAGEECDAGGNTAECDADCTVAVCGDGTINPAAGETCDGGGDNTADCDFDCTAAVCGDGYANAEAGEECDTSGNSAVCDADCTATGCGDHFINPEIGEQCDEGGVNTASCNANCTASVCGDQFVNSAAGEECDESGLNTTTCDADCTAPLCGDGWYNASNNEQCDDAGNSAICDEDCTMAVCGDGFTNSASSEECDDSGESDSCDSDCTVAICGDASVNAAAGEECDTGGESDSCDADCTVAQCGDSYPNALAGEECDDGNMDNGDLCSNTCEDADCQDSILNADETDIDCGGHCGATCVLSNSCATDADCLSGMCVDGLCRVGTIATGGSHTCALSSTGTLHCWGHSSDGRLGYGNTNDIGDNEHPSTVGNVNISGAVRQIAAGGNHTCALQGTGVKCWGDGMYGRLGYRSTQDRSSPGPYVSVGGTVVQVSAGGSHTCALLETGMVRCWGLGSVGQLGYGNTDMIGDNEHPSSVGPVSVGGTVVQISTGGQHTCALLDTGAVRCWGFGANGRLGYGDTDNIGDGELPSSVSTVNIGGTVVQISAGGSHTCALLDTGAVRCWGSGSNGRLGYGDIGDRTSPGPDVMVGGTVVQIATSSSHSCALLDTGAVRCWGAGSRGQLGYSSTDNIGDNELPDSAGPVDVGGTIVQIAAGGWHTCAKLDTGAVRCWGEGGNGRLGYGNENDIGDDEHPASAGDVPYQ